MSISKCSTMYGGKGHSDSLKSLLKSKPNQYLGSRAVALVNITPITN